VRYRRPACHAGASIPQASIARARLPWPSMRGRTDEPARADVDPFNPKRHDARLLGGEEFVPQAPSAAGSRASWRRTACRGRCIGAARTRHGARGGDRPLKPRGSPSARSRKWAKGRRVLEQDREMRSRSVATPRLRFRTTLLPQTWQPVFPIREDLSRLGDLAPVAGIWLGVVRVHRTAGVRAPGVSTEMNVQGPGGTPRGLSLPFADATTTPNRVPRARYGTPGRPMLMVHCLVSQPIPGNRRKLS